MEPRIKEGSTIEIIVMQAALPHVYDLAYLIVLKLLRQIDSVWNIEFICTVNPYNLGARPCHPPCITSFLLRNGFWPYIRLS